MIKKMITGTTLLFTFTVLTLQVSRAQAYLFTHFSALYQELVNGTVLQACNQEYPVVPLGFNFPFLNRTIDSLGIDASNVWHEKAINGVMQGVQIFPFGAGYACRETPNSEISYATVQENGAPVFIVQWKNLGFFEDTVGNQFLNMQLKLYDSDKAIEVRFGGMHIEQENIYFTGESGGFVSGIAYTDPNSPIFDPNCFVLSGDPANPVMDDTFNPDAVMYDILNGHPDSGMVYRFYLQDAGIDSPEQSFFSIYPNPLKTDYLHIHSLTPLKTVRILTISGQQTGENRKPDALSTISIADLEKGTYLIEATSETGTQTIRFIRE